MATMKFELVSPERRLASTDADAVTIPGYDGDLTAMPNHAPFLTNLRPGMLVVRTGGSETRYAVTGGFAEITPEAVTVLAEQAVEGGEARGDWMQARIDAAHKAHEEATAERKPGALQHLHDVNALSKLIEL